MTMSDTTDKTELEKMLEKKLADAAATDAEAEQPATANDAQAKQAAEGTVGDAPAEANDASGEATAADALAQEVEKRTAECEQIKDQLLRTRADFDNYRKRMLREMDQIRQSASANLIRALLPALDNLERALSHADTSDGFAQGVGMVYKQFQEVLDAEGLAPIPSLHEIFDPNVHDALAAMPSETVESGRIIEEYERGYKLRNTVLRPARVIVSSGPPEAATTTEGQTEEETYTDAATE